MRILLRGLIWLLVASVMVMPAVAATPSEFYLTMLRRGVAAYDGGRFDSAASLLRIAAFGFVDSVEQYQTAELYLALTADKMGDAERARDAARKVVAAERLERRYAVLSVPATTKESFEALARRVLTAAEVAVLTAAPATTTTTAPPAQVIAAVEPPQAKAAAEPPLPKPEPPKPATQQPSNPATQQPIPAPQPKPTAPATTQPPSNSVTPQPEINVPAKLAEADRALTAARLSEARAIYRELLEKATLQRAELLRLAEGFYRARDFAHALRAFERIGQLRRGEEPYRYYIAVALYETAQYRRAKDELAAVLPYIEVTPDVERYRAKIESAIN